MIYLLVGLVLVPLTISMMIRGRYRKIYEESRKVELKGGLTGAGVARRILEAEDITDIEIVEHWGLLPDHYDPARRRLNLARPHFRGTDAAALGIAAHEAGHAIQDRKKFSPLKTRMRAIHYSQYLTPIIVIIPVLMMLFRLVRPQVGIVVLFGAWAAILGFNLLTLPAEYDASERSKEILFKKRILASVKEERATYKMMRAAALMYVSGVMNTARWLFASFKRKD